MKKKNSFKKLINVLLIMMAMGGLPFTKKLKGNPAFELILLAQLYGNLSRFYEIYLASCEYPDYFPDAIANVYTMMNAVANTANLCIFFVVCYFREEIAVLLQELETLFDELLLLSPSTTRFLKSVSKQLNFWVLFILLVTLVDTAVVVRGLVVYGEPITYRLVNNRFIFFHLALIYTFCLFTVTLITCTAFLFDHLGRFEVNDEPKRLTHLVQMHRKCCDMARASNRIFKLILSAIFVFNVFGLIAFLAFIFTNDWAAHPQPRAFVASFTSAYLSLLVYISLRAANVNNKLNASLEHILAVAFSFKSSTLTTKKALALRAKLDLYVTHVTLSECYMSNGGIMEMKNTHIVTILGFMLSYVVLIYNKSSN